MMWWSNPMARFGSPIRCSVFSAIMKVTNQTLSLDQMVYRVDGETGAVTIAAEGILGPNGLCFSPDESFLYIVESRGVPHRKILAYDVAADGQTLSNKRIHIDAGPGGTPDGMRADIDGNLWCGWGMGTDALDGVMIFAPDGTKIGRDRTA